MGTCILVPKGVPLSSINTKLLLSNLGTLGAWLAFNPTNIPFFFSPLIATKILSPKTIYIIYSLNAYFYIDVCKKKSHIFLSFILPIYPTPTLL